MENIETGRTEEEEEDVGGGDGAGKSRYESLDQFDNLMTMTLVTVQSNAST